MAQLVKMLVMPSWEPKIHSQHPCEKLSITVCTYNLSTGVTETCWSLGLTRHAYLTSMSCPTAFLSQQNKMDRCQRMTLEGYLWPPHTWVHLLHAHLPPRTGTHEHTQTHIQIKSKTVWGKGLLSSIEWPFHALPEDHVIHLTIYRFYFSIMS